MALQTTIFGKRLGVGLGLLWGVGVMAQDVLPQLPGAEAEGGVAPLVAELEEPEEVKVKTTDVAPTLMPSEVLTGPLSQEMLIRELSTVQDLQGRQRYVDALMRLDELEKFHADVADIYNIRGSIYLSPSIRNFEEAETQFTKAAELSPGALAPLFNLAELNFVRHYWADAAERFDAIAKDFVKLPLAVRHLVHYKRMLTRLKLEKADEAKAILEEQFTFMDDTPAYYFGHAAMAFQADEPAKAQEWLAKANAIFGNRENLAYLDGLMEARWVPNIGLPPMEAAAQP